MAKKTNNKKKTASDYFGPGTGKEKMSGKQAKLIRGLLHPRPHAKSSKWL